MVDAFRSSRRRYPANRANFFSVISNFFSVISNFFSVISNFFRMMRYASRSFLSIVAEGWGNGKSGGSSRSDLRSKFVS